MVFNNTAAIAASVAHIAKPILCPLALASSLGSKPSGTLEYPHLPFLCPQDASSTNVKYSSIDSHHLFPSRLRSFHLQQTTILLCELQAQTLCNIFNL
jgi:hypothetical protein